MRKFFIILTLSASIFTSVKGQDYKLNGGLGYAGSGLDSPGMTLQFELERVYTETYSLPGALNVTFMSRPDYYTAIFEIQKGFRKKYSSGIVVEQAVGAGLIAKRFRNDSYWYTGELAVYLPHGHTTVLGFMPSVSCGLGYQLSGTEEKSALLWMRPKVFWDLGVRGLNLPYAMIQMGFTHTFKGN